LTYASKAREGLAALAAGISREKARADEERRRRLAFPTAVWAAASLGIAGRKRERTTRETAAIVICLL